MRHTMQRGVLAALLLLLLFAAAAAEETEEVFEAYSRVVDVPGVGPVQYYAQNDPAFAAMFYEPHGSSRRRTFEAGACGPTVAAMAIARQVDTADLPTLNAHARDVQKGFPFCACSINGYHCDDAYRKRKGIADPDHFTLTPESPDEFLRWLPVICASYAAGNNDRYTRLRVPYYDGTEIELFHMLAEDYGLSYHATRDWDVAMDALREDASVITTVSQGIFTNGSHYLFLAGADDEYLYIMDSDMRAAYRKDRRGYLEVLEPGLARVRHEDAPYTGLTSFYIIRSAQPQEGDAP